MTAITAADLTVAHDAAQRAIAGAVGLYGGQIYEPVRQRFDRVRNGWGRPHAAAPLMADLREIAAADPDALRRMAMCQAERLGGLHPATERFHATMAAEAQTNSMRPKVSASEFIAALARRGVVVKALDGALQVAPAALLTDADREVLRINKPEIIAEMSRAEVIP